MKNETRMIQRSINQKRALQKLNMVVKVGLATKKWQKQMKNTKQRWNILQQWEKTENSYIQDLQILKKDIQTPLKQLKKINDEENKLLFPNTGAMINLSQNLYMCIKKALSLWDAHKTMIGQQIKVFHKFFMIYRQYCNNFMKAQQIVKRLKLQPQVLQLQSKLKLDIQSYTIKPVQRPPKYQLLLRQYLKALSKSHKDYKFVEQAIEKYQQVNEQNNQSMDRQIRAQLMIKLDHKYGGIISNRTGRQYLRQFKCSCVNFKCHIYAFNDLLLLINQDDSQSIYKRIYLDGTSYAIEKKNFKYFKNMIFICGVNQSAHLQYDNIADASYFYEQINKIISHLYKRQEEKRIRFDENQVKRKNMAKFRVLKWYQQTSSKINYKPKLQIRVQSTLKPKDQPYYAVQFGLISPYCISQTIMITLKKMVQIRQYLSKAYNNLHIPKIDEKPEHIGFIQATKNKTKIIEYRSFIFQEFLNYIFRSEQFYNHWKPIAHKIGINSSFFNFATSQNFVCNCVLCIQMKDKQSIQYYRKLLSQIHTNNKNIKLGSQIKKQSNMKTYSSLHVSSHQRIKDKNICSFYLFNLYQNIRTCQKQGINLYTDRLLTLQAEMGHINYSYLEQQIRPSLLITIRIYLLSIQNQYIEVTLKQDLYVREVLEEIALKNSLDNIFDWGLYLQENDQNVIKIGNDQKLLEFTQTWGVNIEHIQQQLQKGLSLAKMGKIIFGNRKGKIYLKKYLYFQPKLQIQACKNNKQRYQFFINEMFARIKFEKINLKQSELISMCCFYLMIKEFEKIRYFSDDNIDTTVLKEMLPQDLWAHLNTEQFKHSLLESIRTHSKELASFKTQRNAIELIYLKIFEEFKDNQVWITKYYPMSTYNLENAKDVIIGINYLKLTVVNNRDRNIILAIDLQNLKYRTTTFSLFIEEGGKQYRYEGSDTWNIRQQIEIYLTYSRLYLGK